MSASTRFSSRVRWMRPASRRPFLGADDVRQDVQFPRALGALAIGVDVVGHAVLEQLARTSRAP